MNPMFTLSGTVVNVYVAPKGVSKKTGEEFGGEDKVQIMGQIPVEGGQSRLDIVTLTTDQGKAFRDCLNKPVSLPVAFWARSGTVGYYIPRGVPLSLPKRSESV